MVDTSLNKKYTAKEQTVVDFKPLPDGEYTVRVKEVSKWEPKTQNIKVIQRDEKGNAMKDESGKNITELVANCQFYNCLAKLEVVGGEYDKRIIFHNLSTHPNMPFQIPAFLYGLGFPELTAGDIQEHTIGKMALADVTNEEYTKKIVDKDTGIEKEEVRAVNRIKKLSPIPAEPTYEANDLGI